MREDRLLYTESFPNSRELLEVRSHICSCTAASLTTHSSLVLNILHFVGMSAGLPKYIVVNLRTLSEKFTEGEEVSLDTMSQKRMLNLSGREAKLPLKVSLLRLCTHTVLTASGSNTSCCSLLCMLSPQPWCVQSPLTHAITITLTGESMPGHMNHSLICWLNRALCA